ncbi:oligosaccharide flippase family protein [Pedobacter sp. FW305-3-2-15-E-R2A2]|uniref:lipopolysaccharide biosynthesis protein n=1 Tax=Pedobacter sp. FW305-3-2-15-E-R2A2 TaxID=3140251 RepID=UPI003140BEF9
MSRVVKQTIIYSIGEIVPRILSFLLLPILTQYLSPTDYGITSYTTTIMTFIFVIASLSLNTFLLRNYYLEKTEEGRKEIIGAVFVFICLFNLALLLIQLLVFPVAIKGFGINVPFYPFFLLAIINNFFDVISIIPLVLYRIKENPKAFVILSLSKVILQFLLTYLLVVKMNEGLLGSYMARLYVNIPFALIYCYIIYRNGVFVFRIDKIKAALAFSLPLLPASLSYLIVSVSDRIILERFIPLNKLGIYSVAFTLSLALNIVIQALYKTFEQIIFKKHHDEGFNDLNLKLFKVFSIFVICGGLAISIFSQEIFTIIASENFFVGHELVPAMVVAVSITGLNTYLGTLLIANDKRKLVAVLTTISAVLCIALNLIFVPFFGYWGSIYSTILAVSVITVVSYTKLNLKMNVVYYQIVVLSLIILAPYYLNEATSEMNFFLRVSLKLLFTLIVFFVSFSALKIDIFKEIKLIGIKKK